MNLSSDTSHVWVVLQVLSGLASLTDSELDGRQGDKRPQETAAANASIRKDALSCCLQVRQRVVCHWICCLIAWHYAPDIACLARQSAADRPPATGAVAGG